MIFNYPDNFYFSSAIGWLELGNAIEAGRELREISPSLQQHPDVLQVRYAILAEVKDWAKALEVSKLLCELAPENSFSWIHLSYTLYELKRIDEAWGVLSAVADYFPGEYLVPYNLACYACQLGHRDESIQWLEQALKLADRGEVKVMALHDNDLRPIWEVIGKW